MYRAGRNNTGWGATGSAIVRAIIGSVAAPDGTILGFVVVGVFWSTINYSRS